MDNLEVVNTIGHKILPIDKTLFNHTLNNVEMVLVNGDVVTCSDTEKSDLLRVCGNYRRDRFSL